MQAREVGCRVNYTRTVGVFQTTDYGLKTAHCFGIVHSAVSHSTNSRKRSVSVYWTAPTISSGHVVIRTTVVKDSHIFWTHVDSEVMVDLESMDTPRCLSSAISPVPDVERANSPYDTEQVAQGPVTSATTSNPSSHMMLSFLFVVFVIAST
ncbi:putative ferric-chelate reductase 1 [Gigantopelta aegis]|uniref:putative ferric-chelate reductase 1 n=1 Tax=Gigantopelta aegis TaxID=1735272 RepID=UPI001B88929C|nr:putative ferric-chelate reductase 1 [Gigantopelta aegis]